MILQCGFVKVLHQNLISCAPFVEVFPHQTFALYGIQLPKYFTNVLIWLTVLLETSRIYL